MNKNSTTTDRLQKYFGYIVSFYCKIWNLKLTLYWIFSQDLVWVLSQSYLWHTAVVGPAPSISPFQLDLFFFFADFQYFQISVVENYHLIQKNHYYVHWYCCYLLWRNLELLVLALCKLLLWGRLPPGRCLTLHNCQHQVCANFYRVCQIEDHKSRCVSKWNKESDGQ